MTEIKTKTLNLRSSHKNAESFIDAAVADAGKEIITEEHINVKTEKQIGEKKEKKKKSAVTTFYEDKTRFTVYLPQDIYIKWKEYELKMLRERKRISFQAIVIEHIKKIVEYN
jgi:ribonucleotide reductase alpha subunit